MAREAAIEALVQLTRQRGHAGARIALAPESLGGIQITLTMGADGISARLLAERPEAAAALVRASGDLRDQLQRQGITLTSLEASLAGDAGRGFAGRGAPHAAPERSRSARIAAGLAELDSVDDTLHLTVQEAPAATPLRPGQLVDLHA